MGTYIMAMMSLAGCMLSTAAFSKSNFTLNPAGAASIARMAPNLPAADRVFVFVSGPEKQANLALSPGLLRKRVPELVVTNRGDIARVFALLHPRGNKIESGRLPATDGRTYHLLAFDDQKKQMIHIRVFDSGLKSNTVSQVYLQPNSSFGYLNDEIAPWLRSRVVLQRAGNIRQ
jgi:hypothetical protein